jgi:predicted RNase H-like nuclease
MKFVGIDLGWYSQASGLCCLQWDSEKLRLLKLDRKLSLEEILAWCDALITEEEAALISVDAPTLIPNETGMRLPDRLTHKYFGRYHAGCYPANLNRPFAERTVGFGLSLQERGFLHAPTMIPQQLGRYQIEVYPHAAMVELFQLERILKYKKGKLAQRKAELKKLQQYASDVLPQLTPALSLEGFSEEIDPKAQQLGDAIAQPLDDLTGAALKAIEDQLDSLICAYIGAYWWYWGEQRNRVLGDRATGYIIVPLPVSSDQ